MVRYQARQVREAVLEVRETTAVPVVKVEAQSLAEEIGVHLLKKARDALESYRKKHWLF